MKINIRPLYKFPQNRMSDKLKDLFEFWQGHELSDYDYSKERNKYMFQFFQFLLEKYEIKATPALSVFIVFFLSDSLSHLHLYAHALLAISIEEKDDYLSFEEFNKYFNIGFPDKDDLKYAWDSQKSGLINLLETNSV